MFTQFVGTVATVYGVFAALKSLLQVRQMLARRSSRDVSAGFLASYAGGYAIWLAYGLSTGSVPLIVVDTRRPALRGADAGRRPVAPGLAHPPGGLEQAQRDCNRTAARSCAGYANRTLVALAAGLLYVRT